MRNDNERLLYVALTFLFVRCKVVILCPSRCPIPSSHDERHSIQINTFYKIIMNRVIYLSYKCPYQIVKEEG